MRVLITGVCGFIGERLALRLAGLGHDVIGTGRQTVCPFSGLHSYHSVDVLDSNALNALGADVDAIVHLAALTAHSEIVDNRYHALQINLEGTRNALQAFHTSHRARRFVYSSTGKVYGAFTRLPITEEEPPRPLNILGKSKLIAERLVDFYAMGDERQYTALRIFNVYGPGQKMNFLVPTILSQLFPKGSGYKVRLGDIRAARDYLYIDDVIEAFVRVLTAQTLVPGYQVCNVASGIPVSAADIVKQISAIMGHEIEVEADSSRVRADELDEEYGSFARIEELFGWRPAETLESGLARTIKEFACRL